MQKILVAGIGTDVGKTIASAILCEAMEADYWKPVQCGLEKDARTVHNLLNGTRKVHSEGLFLKAPRSPHHAAKLEGFRIRPELITLPKTSRPLIIESAGGLLVPLNGKILMVDLFATWDCEWVLVSRHYLGSINHTLLTLEAMQKRELNIRGIIFNGDRCSETESVILKLSKIPYLGRLKWEKQWNLKRIRHYAKAWKMGKAFQSATRR